MKESTAPKMIIVAAGRGRRLGVETDEIPKCMVKVAGLSILHRQLKVLHATGVRDVVVVRGYSGDRIDGAGYPLRFIDNPAWETNNILASLMFAEPEMEGGFLFSYADIVYSQGVAQSLLATVAAHADAQAVLTVDRRWVDAYDGRTLHPVTEAELCAAGPEGQVTRVGKRAVPQDQAAGEFIGLGYLSAAGARALVDLWHARVADGGLETSFGNAAHLRQAYVTDALNALIAKGARVIPSFIDGQWREIDTGQDLAAAAQVVDTWPLHV